MVPTSLCEEPESIVAARDPMLRSKRIRVLLLQEKYRLAQKAIEHTLLYHPDSPEILFLRECLDNLVDGEGFKGLSDLHSIYIEKNREKCLAMAHNLAVAGDTTNALFCAEILDLIDGERSEARTLQVA